MNLISSLVFNNKRGELYVPFSAPRFKIKIVYPSILYDLHRLNIKTDFFNILVIIFIWISLSLLVNPLGDFPLNDDWAYGWTVKTLLETGNFQLSDWAATNLLPQALWGALFCLPFGFSFTALRFSTLTLSLIGVIVVYKLLRETKASPQVCLIGALLVLLNPIYFGLSNSFNSDVPSFTFLILSVYFLIKGIRLDSKILTLIGIFLSLIAILNRQSSLIILPAFGISYLIYKGWSIRTLIKAFLPTAFGVVVYVAYPRFLRSTGQIPLLYGFQIDKLTETLSSGLGTILYTYLENSWLFLAYLGLFTFPILVLQFSLLYSTFSVRQKQINLYFILLLATVGTALVLKGQQMPFTGNVLVELGLGPVTLDGYDAFLSQDIVLRIMIRGSWALLTLISLVGASILLRYFLIIFQSLTDKRENPKQTWLIVFILFCSFLYFLPIGGIDKKYWFDRYLIPLLPLLIAFVLVLSRRHNSTVRFKPKVIFSVFIMLLCIGTFTITATHDYLSWNRVRWLALNNLMQEPKILPNHIGGGFEFNGLYFGNRIEICNPKLKQGSSNTSPGWEDFSCFWDDANRQYLVTFSPKNGYDKKSVYSFRRWLPWRKQALYVLRKHE